jgi:hypothetical protein
LIQRVNEACAQPDALRFEATSSAGRLLKLYCRRAVSHCPLEITSVSNFRFGAHRTAEKGRGPLFAAGVPLTAVPAHRNFEAGRPVGAARWSVVVDRWVLLAGQFPPLATGSFTAPN